MRPHQLGVAIKNGCEISGRTAQMAFDAGENLVVAPLDNENAFNTMPRGSICTGLATYELLAFFSYAYREPSPLFFQGEWVADMATGCKQGDNFGSLFYAESPNQDPRGHPTPHRRLPRGMLSGRGVMGFIDDTTIYVDARIANLVIAEVLDIYADAGIKLMSLSRSPRDEPSDQWPHEIPGRPHRVHHPRMPGRHPVRAVLLGETIDHPTMARPCSLRGRWTLGMLPRRRIRELYSSLRFFRSDGRWMWKTMLKTLDEKALKEFREVFQYHINHGEIGQRLFRMNSLH